MQGIYSANKVSHPGEIIGCKKVFTSPRWNSWSVQTASWWLSLEYLFLSPGSYSMWILTILFVLLMIQLNIFCFGPNHRYSHLESQLRPCFGGRLLHVCHRHIDPLRSHDIIFLGPRGPLVEQSPNPTQNFCKNSEFLSFFVSYSRLLAHFLSHLGKWVKLIKFEAENECFCTWKI